jgi:hypothetical protein
MLNLDRSKSNCFWYTSDTICKLLIRAGHEWPVSRMVLEHRLFMCHALQA